MDHSHGFTLIELLITTSIVVLLSIIAIASFNNVNINARDSKRQSDLKQIQSALQHYYLDQGFFPFSNGFSVVGFNEVLRGTYGSTTFTNSVGNPNFVSGTTPARTYVQSLPVDPIDNPKYKYVALPNSPDKCDNSSIKCTSYCLYTRMENLPSNYSWPGVCGDASNLPATQPVLNFAVQAP